MQVLSLDCCQFFFLSILVAPFLPEFNIDRVMSLLFWREKKSFLLSRGKEKKKKKEKNRASERDSYSITLGTTAVH